MYDIIINPASRSGRGRKLWESIIRPCLEKEGAAYTPHFSGERGHATQIARELTMELSADARVNLIILGGDGTFNEVLQGIQDFSKVTIGYIPTGSSNDFARDVRISRNPAEALHRILHTGKVVPMDIGSVTFPDSSVHYFAVSCGIGFDAAVCEETNRSRMKEALNRIGLGKLTYLGIALKQLFAARQVCCELSVNERQVTIPKFLFTACMLHRYEGGGFMFAPNADAQDGILDLCAVGSIPKLLILIALPTAFFGKHYMFRGIDAYQTDLVHIRTTAPLWIHTDGEVSKYSDDILVKCHKRAMNIII